MLRRAILLVATLACLVLAGGAILQQDENQRAAAGPVDNWGGWWPKTQFGEDASIDEDVLSKLPRQFVRVSYGSISTECGAPWVSFGHREQAGLGLTLSWSRPGFGASEEELAKYPVPEAGDVTAAIVHDGEVVRVLKNGPLSVRGWVGGSLGTTGSMSAEFDWLPADFEDYWFRLDVKGERFWFLIPYGLGSNPAKNGKTGQLGRGAPKLPKDVQKADAVRSWSVVEYRVLREAENSNFIVNASITNTDFSRVEIELYREKDRWTLDTPRTSATYLWPNGYTRYGWLYELSRDTSYRRWDHFQFFHHGHETRSWGVLRVGVEDKVTDICVPSSLFHARHGQIQR